MFPNIPATRCRGLGIEAGWRLLTASVLFSLSLQGTACAASLPITLPSQGGDRVKHGAAIARLRSGQLLSCWYAGASERARDTRIECARSRDGGAVWEPAGVPVRPGEVGGNRKSVNKSLGNVVLYEASPGHLQIIYGVVPERRVLGLNICTNWACARIDEKVSQDDGLTWSASRRLVDRRGALPRSRPFIAGRIVYLPYYIEGRQRGVLLAGLSGTVFSRDTASPTPDIGPHVIQPALAGAPDGEVRAYFRDPRSKAIRTAVFVTSAGAWGRLEAANLPNPNSAVEVVETTDRVVLIYNPSTSDRRLLALADSEDGRRFEHGCVLVQGEGEVAYPSSIGTSDGGFAIAYSALDKHEIHFRRFTGAQVSACLAQAPAPGRAPP